MGRRYRTAVWALAVLLASPFAEADEKARKPVGGALVGIGVVLLLADAALLFAAGASSFKVREDDFGAYPDTLNFTANAGLLAAGNLFVVAGMPAYLAGLDQEPHRRRMAAGVALTFIGLAALTAGIATAIDSSRLPDPQIGASGDASLTQAAFGLGTAVAGNALLGAGMPLLFDGLPKRVRPSGLGIAGNC